MINDKLIKPKIETKEKTFSLFTRKITPEEVQIEPLKQFFTTNSRLTEPITSQEIAIKSKILLEEEIKVKRVKKKKKIVFDVWIDPDIFKD